MGVQGLYGRAVFNTVIRAFEIVSHFLVGVCGGTSAFKKMGLDFRVLC